MSIDHHDHPQQNASPEQNSFRSAEQGANNAFQREAHGSTIGDTKAAGEQKHNDFNLPKLDLIDGSKSTIDGLKPMGEKPAAGGDKAGDKAGYKGNQGDSADGPKIGDDLKGRIVKAIGANEGDLTHITKNDNGHGISVGIRQWNQRKGELPDLLKSMHDKNPEKFDQTFGPYSKNLQHESYVRRADMAHNPDLMKRMDKALHDPEFQKVQVDKARDFAQKSIDTAKNYGLKTEKGAALVADITNQLGGGGARKALAHAGLHPGGNVKDEEAALKRLEHVTHRPNSRARFDNIASSFTGQKPITRPIFQDTSVYRA